MCFLESRAQGIIPELYPTHRYPITAATALPEAPAPDNLFPFLPATTPATIPNGPVIAGASNIDQTAHFRLARAYILPGLRVNKL